MRSDEEIRALGNLGLGCLFVFSLSAPPSSDPSPGDADKTQALHCVEGNEMGLPDSAFGSRCQGGSVPNDDTIDSPPAACEAATDTSNLDIDNHPLRS